MKYVFFHLNLLRLCTFSFWGESTKSHDFDEETAQIQQWAPGLSAGSHVPEIGVQHSTNRIKLNEQQRAWKASYKLLKYALWMGKNDNHNEHYETYIKTM